MNVPSAGVVVTAIACAVSAALTAIEDQGGGSYAVLFGLSGFLFGAFFGGGILFPLGDVLVRGSAAGFRGAVFFVLYMLLPVPILVLGVLISVWATDWAFVKFFR